MADLGSAYVNIVPKAPGISNKITDLLSSGGGPEKAGQSIGKKLVGTLAKVGIGAAVGKMVKDAFSAGGALQQSFGGLETIYGDAAEGAKEYARAAAAAGISANEYAEQAVSFGAGLKAAFGGDTAKAMEAANTAILDMADNAAKMGTPLESIQNAYQGFAKGNFTMLDNLKLGYGGTKEEMARLLKDAEKLTGKKYDLSNLGDIYDAIHVIQGELGLTGVAAGEAETTLTGSLGSVKASWENVMGALTTGEGLGVAMSNLGKSVGNFGSVAMDMFGQLSDQLPDMILGLADVVIDNAPSFLAAGAQLIIKLVTGLVQRIPDIAAKIPEIWESFKTVWGQTDWKGLGNSLVNAIGDGIYALNGYLSEKATELGDALKAKWDAFDFKAFGTSLIDKIKDGVKSAGGRIWTALKGALDSAKQKITTINWSDFGGDIVDGIISGLKGAGGRFVQAVKDLIKKGLTGGQEEAEVGSPSKLFARELGQWIPLGIAEGINSEASAVDTAVQDAVSGAARRASMSSAAATAADASASRDTDRIIEALRTMQFETRVVLEGDADGLLRVINKSNWAKTNATGYNRLAAVGAR